MCLKKLNLINDLIYYCLLLSNLSVDLFLSIFSSPLFFFPLDFDSSAYLLGFFISLLFPQMFNLQLVYHGLSFKPKVRELEVFGFTFFLELYYLSLELGNKLTLLLKVFFESPSYVIISRMPNLIHINEGDIFLTLEMVVVTQVLNCGHLITCEIIHFWRRQLGFAGRLMT